MDIVPLSTVYPLVVSPVLFLFFSIFAALQNVDVEIELLNIE
jgi:hypothetical protein